MNLDQRLENVAVLGAGGKMGSGISWLLAKEMITLKRKPENRDRAYTLTLIDVASEPLEGVRSYLQMQAKKYVQKKTDLVKALYPEIDSTEQLESQFIRDVTALIRPATQLKDAANALLIFEAIVEKLDVKVAVFKELQSRCSSQTYFFSNTSSIPIKELDTRANLGGRIIGFHFYNPPAVQRLVELIIPEKIVPELPELSRELAKRLGKIVIPSNDVAGFIGNGHFTRDGLHGISEAQHLAKTMGFVPAIYIMNRVSQEFLIRPMGIFQLIDYVGLDVFQSILNIMNPYFPDEHLHSDLIDELVSRGIKGGQYADGSQKNGFLQYDHGKIVGIYDIEKRDYIAQDEGDWRTKADEFIGPLPEGHAPWKNLIKHPEKEAHLRAYFSHLAKMETPGAQLAVAYLKRSREIGLQLISGGVANSKEDVNGVLMNGFFHLYGPINDFV